MSFTITETIRPRITTWRVIRDHSTCSSSSKLRSRRLASCQADGSTAELADLFTRDTAPWAAPLAITECYLMKKRVIVGITGALGVIYGIRPLLRG